MTDYVFEHLKTIARRLDDCDHEGLVLTADEVMSLARRIRKIAAIAVDLECEVSRHRWNLRAAQERIERDRIDHAVAASGGSIIHFPGGRPQ